MFNLKINHILFFYIQFVIALNNCILSQIYGIPFKNRIPIYISKFLFFETGNVIPLLYNKYFTLFLIIYSIEILKLYKNYFFLFYYVKSEIFIFDGKNPNYFLNAKF